MPSGNPGEKYGLKPMGMEALDILRIRSGLTVFVNYEFNSETDEAGIAFTVPLKSKPDDFIGREALIQRKGILVINSLVSTSLNDEVNPSGGRPYRPRADRRDHQL